jgi:hypothetical protein
MRANTPTTQPIHPEAPSAGAAGYLAGVTGGRGACLPVWGKRPCGTAPGVAGRLGAGKP